MGSRNISTEQTSSTGLRSSSLPLGRDLRGGTRMLIVAGAVFLLIAGIGAATTYLAKPPDAPRTAHSSAHDETLARLEDYTRSLGTEAPAPTATPDKLVPDVNTMIERLAARLETSPEDAKGWRMLGWSYFHTERYKQAATAYARAVELNPHSAELKLEFEHAKAKASAGDGLTTASPLQTKADRSSSDHTGP